MPGAKRRGLRAPVAALACALVLLLVGDPSAHGESSDPLAGGPSGSELRFSESEWAEELAAALGLSQVLGESVAVTDLFAVLCPARAPRSGAGGSRSFSEAAPIRVAVEIPQEREPGAPVRSVVHVPAPALYQLSVAGVGRQRWTIDRRPVGHLDLSPLGVAHASTILPLRKGPHEIAGYLTRHSRVERVELAVYRPLCVAPTGGWRGERPLRYGALARTLVTAFGFERRLPEDIAEQQVLEGELFEAMTGGGRRTTRRLAIPATGGAWALAANGPSEFTWRLHLEDPRVVTILARTHGEQAQVWSLDGRHRLTVNPDSVPEGFAWNHVITLPLSAGGHAIRALVARGSGIDLLRVVHHRASDADYVGVLETLGFRAGAPDALVPRSAARDILSGPALAELSSAFQRRLAGDRRDQTLWLVDEEPAPLYTRPLSPVLPAEL